jgi:hypothetical protein
LHWRAAWAIDLQSNRRHALAEGFRQGRLKRFQIEVAATHGFPGHERTFKANYMN